MQRKNPQKRPHKMPYNQRSILGKLRVNGALSLTQIYGGMKIGDRDTLGTRISAERIFKEECKVMAEKVLIS
jgi:hypothetical protein